MKAKQLAYILKNVRIIEMIGDSENEFFDISIDSRKAIKKSAFVAIKGHNIDGHEFIDNAIEKGVNVILCETLPSEIQDKVCYLKIDNTRKASGLIAHALLDYPAQDMKIIGVTGTNGKTSVCTLLFQLFRSFGYKVGLLSTVENKIDDDVIQATHTTPDPIELAKLLARMRDHGCGYVFMEVSSHAIDQDRIEGLTFDIAVFTNISHDHLDYHGSFLNYIKTKKKFFDRLNEDAYAIVNADDKNGRIMVENCDAKHKFYSMRGLADYRCQVVYSGIEGLQLKINGKEAFMLLTGKFNAYNLTCVYAVAEILGEEEEGILVKMSELQGAEGRFQKVIDLQSSRIGIVDYAHTPDALENVLKTILEVRTQNNNIITVFGCGGDRDKAKRGLMGKIAARYSNKVIVTSDNPRSENPEAIMEDILLGVDKEMKNKVVQIVDRESAIKAAVMMSSDNDIILVAGKGHEKYQEIEGKKFPFEDKTVLSKAIFEAR